MPARLLLPLLAAFGAGCSWQGPSLAGHEGLQWQVISYYDARALEMNAVCTRPRMTTITNTELVEETPQRIVMDLRYPYRDDGNSISVEGAGDKPGCDGWAERRFTFGKTSAGNLLVESMSGPQRQS